MGIDLGIRSDAGNLITVQEWIVNWLQLIKKQADHVNAKITFLATLWTIWCTMNMLIFQGGDLSDD